MNTKHNSFSQQKAQSNNSSPQAPSISLLKGGGAIRGIGEKFTANPVTGTGSMSVPITTSPGRSGFGPQLSLSYDSGGGNGAFGFGWSLSLPNITRKTDKGLPLYHDSKESDVFIVAGAEDLVPVLDSNDDRFEDRNTAAGYTIHRYRPRIEGLYARIERWTDQSGDIHWRSISKDNITTVYGKDSNSRIFDPNHPTKIFTWLICESYDDKGNAITYDYIAEDDQKVDLSQSNERNRTRNANRYVKRIKYGNRTSRLIQPDLTKVQWLFEVVFDYDEDHVSNEVTYDDGQTFVDVSELPRKDWTARADPFSTYRASFEVRTYRLCQRILIFHHIPDTPDGNGYDGLVRSTDFTYSYEQNPTDARNPVYTFLNAVTQNGYVPTNGGYLKRGLPPVEFEYSQPVVQETVEEVDNESLENLPIGLDGTVYQWTDLHGEGISGILTEQSGAWYYKRNLSPISMIRADNGLVHAEAKFAPIEAVAIKPNNGLAEGQGQFMDLAGDGQPDLVILDGSMAGFYEHDDDDGWQPFRPFTSRLNRNMRDPNLRFVDLNGDGHADVLITEEQALVWHSSLAEQGFGPAQRVAQVLDEEKGPRLVFADGTQSIYLADLSGDGLSDLVRIRHGEVCYWPNLGYGHFGPKVTMDNAPYFDNPDQFDQKRIRLADIDGSGTTDIIYLHRDGVRLYFNQSGNSWSKPHVLRAFPRVDDVVSITPVDLLGNGTACLVWSSPLPGDSGRQMRYVNLMGDQKPHLLIKTVNNLGAETHVKYVPSTKFYLQDKYNGKPWITRLPFPLHVVERVETYDHISRNRFVTRYAYHHGYFDGEEREFRGFGMVEQWDTEEFTSFDISASVATPTNEDLVSHVPPTLTRTWFHTGVYLGSDRISNYFAGLVDENDRGEYYREPAWLDDDDEARKHLLLDTIMPHGLSVHEEREASRALKGMMLRQEIYALDGSSTPDYPFGHPYTVTEQNFTIKCLQSQGNNRHAVFFTHPREAIVYHYERNFDDPRIAHNLTLEVDSYGNVLKELAIGYGRRIGESPLEDDDKKKQEETFITFTENVVTNVVDSDDDYRTPLPAETLTFQMTGFEPDSDDIRFSFDQWTDDDFALLTSAIEIGYEKTADHSKRQKRLIEHVRTLYRKNDLSAIMELGKIESMALPGESYKLALTPALIAKIFKRKRNTQPDENLLPELSTLLEGKEADEGGYIAWDGGWWIPSGRTFYSPKSDDSVTEELAYAREHFYLIHRYRDPFHTNTVTTETSVKYDSHDLLMVRTSDPLGNTVTVETSDDDGVVAIRNDYRVLQPYWVTDPNGNRTQVAFDAMGLVVGTAIMGKPLNTSAEGDTLEGFKPDLTDAQIDGFFDDVVYPHVSAPAFLGNATKCIIYDLDCFWRSKQDNPEDPSLWRPTYAATLARETHLSDPLPPDGLNIQISFSYSDGFGREMQKKIQAEPGLLVEDGLVVDPRWVGSGWTIFNNKGKPVRQYEPFFDDTHHFRFGNKVGVSPVLFYDPLERVIATLHPNNTYEKVVFDPWQQITYDVNDTVAAPDDEAEIGDPRTDRHIKGYVAEYFQAQPDDWETWYQLRIVGQDQNEKTAAEKSAVHANTPTIAHFDSLGRPLLTIAHNRFDLNGTVVDEHYATRVELDIEGNQRAVMDAKDRIVMQYDYDMLSNRIHQASMEAGERWILNDVAGKPIRTWDSRRFLRRMSYDALRRPTGLYVTENGTERLAERTVYGEGQGISNNHRTRVYQVHDGTGVVTNVEYDFKGNLLESKRDLLPDYQNAVDWNQNLNPNDGSYTTSTTYDALNRPTSITTPDNSVYRPTFNEANLLDKVDVNLRGANSVTPFVSNIDYDAKGQRKKIMYGKSVETTAETTYEYDLLTFRLIHLKTTRIAGRNGLAPIFEDPTIVQDLYYTYDPNGNITHIEDKALKTVYHNNQEVKPISQFTYDSMYRLIEAKGREHIGQMEFGFDPPNGNYRDHPFVGLNAHPNDLQALRNYTQQYEYDAVGNFVLMQHQANSGSWKQHYDYEEDSLIEAVNKSNRLTRTRLGNSINRDQSYTHDKHGNMTSMPHLSIMVWDFKDQLQATTRQVVNNGTTETTYYIYDVDGQRVRKVTVNRYGKRTKERIYLGGYEVYREYNNDDEPALERETLHIMDDKQRIAIVETQTIQNGSVVNAPLPLQRYQLGNHLGSASVELAADASLISYEEYHPYGTTAFQAGRTAAEVRLKRYRYTGKERDEECGFYYHGARYYAPWFGRWVSTDPVGLIDGKNLYRFVGNNPIKTIDSNGMNGCDPQTQTCLPLPSGEEVVASDGEPIPIDSTPLERKLQQSIPSEHVSDADGSEPKLPKIPEELGDFELPDDPSVITEEYWDNLTEAQQRFLHYNRNRYQANVGIPETEADLVQNEWDSKGEAIAHNVGKGVSGNIDYRGVGPRAHQQAVYDASGNLVTTPENLGTYDFITPDESIRGHWVTDVNPWINWGNAPDDTSTREERIEAVRSSFLGDIGYRLYGPPDPSMLEQATLGTPLSPNYSPSTYGWSTDIILWIQNGLLYGN